MFDNIGSQDCLITKHTKNLVMQLVHSDEHFSSETPLRRKLIQQIRPTLKTSFDIYNIPILCHMLRFKIYLENY